MDQRALCRTAGLSPARAVDTTGDVKHRLVSDVVAGKGASCGRSRWRQKDVNFMYTVAVHRGCVDLSLNLYSLFLFI